jgi:DNA-binding winged helix-turn-helix (wHTH) protein
VDLKREELFKDGARIKLPGKVYQTLVTLLERPGEIVSREDLRQRLWPEGTHVNFDANVNTTVNKLRLALGDSPDQPVYVETIPRQGYSFVATVNAATMEAVPQRQTPNEALENNKAPELSKQGDLLAVTSNVSKWFVAGVTALVISGMFFGAAAVMYFRHTH